MKLKRILSTLVAAVFIVTTAIGTNSVYADEQSTPTLDLTVTPNNAGNYNDLKWDISGMSQGYSYRLYSKESGETQFQSIPCKGTTTDTVNVLNIYPDQGDNLKGWMENANSEDAHGYGKNIIKVDAYSIDDFNANPDKYLKDSNGNWKYDVIYLGAWNANNYKDISINAEKLIEEFIQSGRGYLGGHDTIWMQLCNLEKLKKFLNIKTALYTDNPLSTFSNEPFNDYQKNANTDFNVYSPHVGGNSVSILKKGLLTDYPWNIVNENRTLSIPYSHTTGQFAYGDIWMKFINYNGCEISSPEGKGTNNFYLTTWNNTGMIQTGNSDGQATPDEQKILANTLFYLAQVTDKTSWEDHKGQDVDAPTKPIITSANNDIAKNQVSINFNPSTDNGSTYDYYVEATNKSDGSKITSEKKEATITTGLKGYSIVVDENPNTDPGKEIKTTSTNYVVTGSHKKDFYVHIAAIDNANNESEVTHQKISAVSGINLNKTSDEIYTGHTDTLTASVTPDDAVNKDVTWTSSNPSIATVDETGKITALEAGTATITAATANGTSASCTVTVKPTTIALNKTTDKIDIGGTDTLTAAVTPKDVADKGLTWRSSNKSIATVDKSGKVTGVGVGTAVIMVATADGEIDSCTVTVKKPTTIKLNKVKDIIDVGGADTLTAIVTPDEISSQGVTWQSSDSSIATVDASGKITGVKAGTVTVTATTADGKTASCTVTVKDPTTIALNKTTDKIDVGGTDTLTALITPLDIANSGAAWQSSDPSIATVDITGKITGVKAGTAVITAATADGKTATCTVIVKEPTTIKLNKTTDTMDVGQTEVLTATITPDEIASQGGTWTTSDSTVATVDITGKVTAVKPGKVVITAKTVDGKTASCTITVKYPTTITLNKTTDTLEAGTTDALTATVTPDEIASKGVTWSTSDKTIATVDASGNVIALGVGTTTITATTADGKTATCTVTVIPEINRDKAVLCVTMVNGQTKIYNVTMDSVNKFISWYRLKSTGVGALYYGISEINKSNSSIVKTDYIAFDKISSFEVDDYTKSSVKSKYLTKITLNKATDTLKAGETDALTATVTPDEISDKGVIWSTSDKTIADVDVSGKITALKDGTAVITATTDDGKTASCTVTVTQAANHDDALLSITMTNGQTKKYNIKMDTVNDFISWINLRSTGVGEPFYKFDLTQCSAPSIAETDYVTFDKIVSYNAEDESN
ncbi:MULTISPECIES: Ig-like domain-containing protein [Clostridium]|uniref:Ig-like domain-containing protein n=1 Tax=Clostridium TaxID=1485 RepID=UPI00082506FF|nr:MULTISPECIES: Ig-like domain-containing protein [Clostridium]PJI08991.1 hypothetical protein CUB90_14445 [Clostridium sp. CT7]